MENAPARGAVVPESGALVVVSGDESAGVERRVHGDEEGVLPLDAKHVRLPVKVIMKMKSSSLSSLKIITRGYPDLFSSAC